MTSLCAANNQDIEIGKPVKTNNMEKKIFKSELYVAPMIEFLGCEAEGVLCSSFEIYEEEKIEW